MDGLKVTFEHLPYVQIVGDSLNWTERQQELKGIKKQMKKNKDMEKFSC